MKGQIEGQLTLFQVGSLVNHFPSPGSDGARTMTASSGRRWLELSKNCGRLGLLEKMLLESSIWHSPIYFLNWDVLGIPQGHFLFRLVLSEPDTEDTELRLWATLTTNETEHPGAELTESGRRKTKDGSASHSLNLADQVQMFPTPKASVRGDCPSERERRSPDLAAAVNMWPTPRANKVGGVSSPNFRPTLEQAVKMYNTPTAQDAKNSTLPPSQAERDSLVGDLIREQRSMYPTPTTGAGLCGGTGNFNQLKKLEAEGVISETERKSMSQGNGGQLNPRWVEWLMGFPEGWTEI